MSLLSDSEASGDEGNKNIRLKINEKFAGRFEQAERVKDLHRAKELLKNADQEDDESDSESETEDEDAEQLSTGLDLKIIQTINSLRKKDPKIYDPKAKWFDAPAESDSDSDDEENNTTKVAKKKKFKDILREQLLDADAKGGMGNGDGIEDATRGVRDTASRSTLVYDAEQERIRQAFIKSAGGSEKPAKKSNKAQAEDSSEDEDNILTVKSKTPQELKEEELELKKALKEMCALSAKEEKPRKAEKKQTVLLEHDDADGFLENYLEKQMWKDKDTKSARRRQQDESESDNENIDEDADELEEMERFESKYNFRFEELQDQQARGGEGGGMVEVTGHARNIQGSMRRADEKRKTQRESRKERKEKERRQQEAELRRLKNLKRQELRERLKQIGAMSGLKGVDEEDDDEELGSLKNKNKMKLNEDFLDEDWDPEKHEALMAAQFGDDYYGEEDGDFNVADMDDIDAYEKYLGDDGLGDADYDYDQDNGAEYGEDNEQDDEQYGTRTGKAGKGASAEYKQAASEMADELYQLDYEDIVAGLPCRFKYKQVEKEGFGLTAEDILLADDSELNKYVSLKKISAYSHHSVPEGDLSKKRKRLRENVKERLAQQALEAEARGQQLKGTKPKAKEVVEDAEEDEDAHGAEGGAEDSKKRKRKRRKGGNGGSADTADVAAEEVPFVRPERVGAKPSKTIAAPAVAAASDGASASATVKKDKDKKKKSKKSGKEKEKSEVEKRLSLYR